MKSDLPQSADMKTAQGGQPWWRAAMRPFAALLDKQQLFRRVLMRDIEASFRGSALGLLWIVLVPLVMVALYTFVFGVVMRSAWATPTASPLEVPLIYFSGISIATFFLEVLNRSPNYIRSHASYVKKIIFPLDLLPWVLVGTAAVKLGISLALLTVALSVVEQRPAWEILYMPVLLLPYFVLMLGLSWILTAIGTYIRDLGHVLTVISPVVMFVSPVFYALDRVPEGARPLYLLNPLTFILENTRRVLFMGESINWLGFMAYSLVALLVFSLGYRFFERARPGFADVI